MAHIPSPNPDFPVNPSPGGAFYRHPADTRKPVPIPMAFQITSPFNRNVVLLPHALVLHVNPASLEETAPVKVERFPTMAGWGEQHWRNNLIELSAEGSTGSFLNLYTGVTSVLRQQTIAFDRYRDLLDIFRNNGSVHNPSGQIVLQGYVMLMYDRGTYLGAFRTFDVTETEESPFAFKLNWTFKAEYVITSVDSSTLGRNVGPEAPAFQSTNTARQIDRTYKVE